MKLRSLVVYSLVLGAAIAYGGWQTARPVDLTGLGPIAHPAASYEEAVGLIQSLKTFDDSSVHPLCRLEFMDHGKKTERVIVLLHGVTNCPRQFHELGEMFYRKGWNVLLPRIPHHGLADRMTGDLARLNARELAAITAVSVDIAQGLGDHVVVVGLSMSGVMAAWAAQHRSDVDLAVVIAPCFSYRLVAKPLVVPVVNLVETLPNFFIWWNPKLKEQRPGSDTAYPRVASRALGEALRLSLAVQAAARRAPPAAQAVIVVTNGSDQAIDRGTLKSVLNSWRRHGARNVYTFEFGRGLRLPHDLIDPMEVGQRVGVVYPKLAELVEAAPANP